MLSCSSESIHKSKAKDKASGFPQMVLLEFFTGKKSEKFKAEGDASQCVNNVIKLCYYLSGFFSAFRI